MRILIVDDSPITRKIIKLELSRGGYDFLDAGDGEEALKLAIAEKPDLITLDVDMPKLDGYETCKKIRDIEMESAPTNVARKRIPIIFITANDSPEGREKGFQVGATDFITKPFARGDLLTITDRILKAKNYLAGTTALIVEDSAILRHVVADILTRQGVTVHEAVDGVAGLEAAKEMGHHLDMIITDYHMPGMNGEELCARIRNELKLWEIPVIILSGVEDKALIVRLFKAGATDFLIKPFAIEELLARINIHLKLSLLNRELTQKNNAMREELELAGEVQRTAIQEGAEVDFLEKSISYLPFGDVSGDVYDFTVNDHGDLCFFLGDATGHGIAAALMTMMVESGLDTIGREKPVHQMMDHLNRLLSARSGSRFVTGIYGTVSPSGLLTFSTAGHPPLILLPKQEPQRSFSEIGGLPLGLGQLRFPYESESVQLQPGDKFFVYTDGITEWENSKKSQYGMERFQHLLEKLRSGGVKNMVDGILEDLKTFSEGVACNDDLTLIGFEYLGGQNQ